MNTLSNYYYYRYILVVIERQPQECSLDRINYCVEKEITSEYFQ